MVVTDDSCRSVEKKSNNRDRALGSSRWQSCVETEAATIREIRAIKDKAPALL